MKGTGITTRKRRVVDGKHAIAHFQAQDEARQSSGGDFGLATRDAVQAAHAILLSAQPDPKTGLFPPDSKGWFASRIVALHSASCELADQGRADEAMRMAFDLGALWATFVFKTGWEREALAGEKCLTAGGGRPKGKTASRDRAMAEEFSARQAAQSSKSAMAGRLSDTKIKAQLATEFGLSKNAGIQAIDRGLKILSGKPGKQDS